MPDVSLSKIAADLSRLHSLLSLADGDPDSINDPRFEAAIRRRLKKNPVEVRQIAAEVAMLMSD